MKLIEDTEELRGRRWAVVADEAHSSQSGSAAKQLKELLVDVELDPDEEISADDLLAAKDSAIAASANITFVALTATPKGKTLRLFGTQVGTAAGRPSTRTRWLRRSRRASSSTCSPTTRPTTCSSG